MALFDYDADADDEISFVTGDIILVENKIDDGWWHGSNKGDHGLFPANYVVRLYYMYRVFGYWQFGFTMICKLLT